MEKNKFQILFEFYTELYEKGVLDKDDYIEMCKRLDYHKEKAYKYVTGIK